jgi:hypothetical protein
MVRVTSKDLLRREGWYAHIPGLRILAPATLEDARGMLGTALASPDPVLIFEHASLYNMEGKLDEKAGPVDIDRAAVRRPGKDVTLITYERNSMADSGDRFHRGEGGSARTSSRFLTPTAISRPLIDGPLGVSCERAGQLVQRG